MKLPRRSLSKYAELFCHRQDIHAIQKSDGSYFLVHRPITVEVIRQHLKGELTGGWYALRPDNTIRWISLDADQSNGLKLLQQIWQKLNEYQLTAYLEESRRGGHLWVFTEPTQAFILRTLLKHILAQLAIEQIEIYPRQDKVPVGGLGSLMRGPLGVHQLTDRRYYFLDPVQLEPVSASLVDQLDHLLSFRVNSVHQVARVLAEMISHSEKQPAQEKPIPTKIDDGSKIKKLKAQIGDLYLFVSQYVELDAKGRGSCPFHPPDQHSSFAVSREKGYWICFHEINPETGRYLGGDAIEFYRRLKGLSVKAAVRELANLYGITD